MNRRVGLVILARLVLFFIYQQCTFWVHCIYLCFILIRWNERKNHMPILCLRCKTATRKELCYGVLIDKCPSCKGIWIDSGEELEALKRNKAIPIKYLMAVMEKELHNERRSLILHPNLCPKCSNVVIYFSQNGIHLDKCKTCGCIFFDADELEEFLKAYRNRPMWKKIKEWFSLYIWK